MPEVTIAIGAALAVAGVNALPALLGAARWWRVAPSDAFWPLLRAGQVVAGAQALAAGVLFLAGFSPEDDLYWLYALLPIAIGVVAEQLRIASAEQVLEQRGLADATAVGRLPEADQRSVVLAVVRREIGVMTLAALVVVFLALRAAMVA